MQGICARFRRHIDHTACDLPELGIIVRVDRELLDRIGFELEAHAHLLAVGRNEQAARQAGAEPCHRKQNRAYYNTMEHRNILLENLQVGVSYQEMEKEYLSRVSLRRMVTPHDVAAMVLFLLSPMGENISGQSLSVDGNVETL